MGSFLEETSAFPHNNGTQSKVGYQLHKIQYGIEPDDWKPFSEIGAGVNEIRIRDNNGIYRVMYVAKFEEALYVLHSFQNRRNKPVSTIKTSPERVITGWCNKRRNSL